MSAIDVLTNIKNDLQAIAGINSVAIGIETSINPKDYPAIRIVPLEHKPDSAISRSCMSVDVYIGFATKPQSLEDTYATLYAWSDEVIQALSSGNGYSALWQSTTNDEDRLPAAKMVCVSFEVVF